MQKPEPSFQFGCGISINGIHTQAAMYSTVRAHCRLWTLHKLISFLQMQDFESDGRMPSLDNGQLLPVNTAQHRTRLESSTTML